MDANNLAFIKKDSVAYSNLLKLTNSLGIKLNDVKVFYRIATEGNGEVKHSSVHDYLITNDGGKYVKINGKDLEYDVYCFCGLKNFNPLVLDSLLISSSKEINFRERFYIYKIDFINETIKNLNNVSFKDDPFWKIFYGDFPKSMDCSKLSEDEKFVW